MHVVRTDAGLVFVVPLQVLIYMDSIRKLKLKNVQIERCSTHHDFPGPLGAGPFADLAGLQKKNRRVVSNITCILTCSKDAFNNSLSTVLNSSATAEDGDWILTCSSNWEPESIWHISCTSCSCISLHLILQLG